MSVKVEALLMFLREMEERQNASVQRSLKALSADLQKKFSSAVVDAKPSDALEKRIAALEAEITRLRLKLAAPANNDRVLVLCPFYPGGAKGFGGEFIHSRVKVYQEFGVDVQVFEVSGRDAAYQEAEHDGVVVYRGGIVAFEKFLTERPSWHRTCLIHFIQPEMVGVLLHHFEEEDLIVWLHGYEARDHRRLAFNFTAEFLEKNSEKLEAVTHQRMELLRQILPNERIKKVFVSNFCRAVAQEDSGASSANVEIIHNVIDENIFRYVPKNPDDRFKVLLLRAFTAKNYANDIAIDALKILSTHPVFERLEIHVQGFGPLFAEMTQPLSAFRNVKCIEAHASPEEIVALHARHGVMLVPSRFDTQGVTLGEAMCSGLVAVTNPVAAIPEFVDHDTVVLCEPDSPTAYAQGLLGIFEDPERFLRISEAAARRVRAQCAREMTVLREVDLIKQKLEARP